MRNEEAKLCFYTLVAAYPEFNSDRIEEALTEWEEILRGKEFNSVMPRIKAWIENHDEPPAISDIVEDPIGDDGTMRHLAKVYAEVCRITLPELKSDREAIEWFIQQEGEFEQQ